MTGPRFFAEFGLFVGAMLTLVLSNSTALLFAAWELVGLASFLLIGFEHAELGAAGAAAKAFLMTRIGDVGLLLGWLLALSLIGTSDIDALVGAVEAGRIAPGAVTLMALLVMAGALGKSAQLPLSAWLPDAMVGPSPVSALLHSATMVAAGVFLVLRLYPVFAASPVTLDILLWVGAATALATGLIATAEADLKRGARLVNLLATRRDDGGARSRRVAARPPSTSRRTPPSNRPCFSPPVSYRSGRAPRAPSTGSAVWFARFRSQAPPSWSPPWRLRAFHPCPASGARRRSSASPRSTVQEQAS